MHNVLQLRETDEIHISFLFFLDQYGGMNETDLAGSGFIYIMFYDDEFFQTGLSC